LSFFSRIFRRKKTAVKLTLAQALEAAIHDGKHAPKFFLAFLEGNIWTLSHRNTEADFSPFLFADAQGAPFLPVFSGAALIPGDLPAQAFPVQLKGKDALAQVRGKAAVVLNPGQANFKYFSVSDVENILDRLVAPAAEAASGAITHEHDHGQGHSHASAPLQISTFSEEDWNLIGRPKQSESPASRGPHSVV
jgi:hypothetical protein